MRLSKLSLLLLAACGPAYPLSGPAPPAPPGAPAARPPGPEAPGEVRPAPEPLSRPAAAGCAAGSLADAEPAVGPGRLVPHACLEEVFGPDGCPEERFTRTFDGADRRLDEAYDILEDRVRDRPVYFIPESWRMAWSYDEAGRERTVARTGLESGSYEQTTLGWDAEGRMILREVRNEAPHWSPFWRERWSFHGNGELARYETDDGATVYHVQERTLDGEGRVILEETTRLGGPSERVVWEHGPHGPTRRVAMEPHGTPLVETTFTYDDAGRLETMVEDHLDFGWIDTSFFDDAGRVVRLEEDSDRDGTVDYVQEATFDEAGNPLTARVSYGGPRGPVVDDQRWTYEGGRLVRHWHRPSWADGQEHVTELTWSGDGEARDEVTTHASSGGGLVRAWLHRYDRDGNRVLEEHDLEGDGVLDVRTRSTFDGPRLLEQRVDHGADGSVEYRTVHDWDPAGNPLSSTEDHDGDGVADLRHEWRYGCF